MEQVHSLTGDTLASKVSNGVWDVLKVALGSGSDIVKRNEAKDLNVDEDALRRNLENPRELTNELLRITQRAYDDIPFKNFEECADQLRGQVEAIVKEDPTAATADAEGVASAADEEPSAAAGGDDDEQLMEEKTATLAPVVKPPSLAQRASEAVWEVIVTGLHGGYT